MYRVLAVLKDGYETLLCRAETKEEAISLSKELARISCENLRNGCPWLKRSDLFVKRAGNRTFVNLYKGVWIITMETFNVRKEKKNEAFCEI